MTIGTHIMRTGDDLAGSFSEVETARVQYEASQTLIKFLIRFPTTKATLTVELEDGTKFEKDGAGPLAHLPLHDPKAA